MFTTLFSLALLIALVLAQSPFWIDTPALVQCQPAQITWSSTGNPPYDLLVVSAQDVCGNALEDLGNQTSTDLTWTVDLAAGTQVVLSLQDLVGNEAWSGAITIGSSNDTSCLASTSSSASTLAVTGTPLTVLPSGGTATHATTSSSPKSSASGTATAGLSLTSGALSTRPLGVVTLFSSAVLAVVAFAL